MPRPLLRVGAWRVLLNFFIVSIDVLADFAVLLLVLSNVDKVIHLLRDLKLQGVLLYDLASHNFLEVGHSNDPCFMQSIDMLEDHEHF